MMVASGVFFVLNLVRQFPADLTALLDRSLPCQHCRQLADDLRGQTQFLPHRHCHARLPRNDHGKFRNHYWWGGIALGHVIPLG
jgi:hypothetical protein